MLQEMKALAKAQDICVLATASDNKPHCSLMSYVTDEECSEIYMLTSRKTRKYENMAANPCVSLLIDTREQDRSAGRSRLRALTIGGRFRKVEDDATKSAVLAKLLGKHPHLEALADQPDAEIVCIRIESFLLLDGVMESHFEKVS